MKFKKDVVWNNGKITFLEIVSKTKEGHVLVYNYCHDPYEGSFVIFGEPVIRNTQRKTQLLKFNIIMEKDIGGEWEYVGNPLLAQLQNPGYNAFLDLMEYYDLIQ